MCVTDNQHTYPMSHGHITKKKTKNIAFKGRVGRCFEFNVSKYADQQILEQLS